jgi:hypothetical protein
MAKPKIPEPAPVKVKSSLAGELACMVGFHKWRDDCDYVMGCATGEPLVLTWRQCARCHKSELFFISH